MPVRRLTFILCTVFLVNSVFSQTPASRFANETFQASEFKPFVLKIDIKKSERIHVGFAAIEFGENRPDTTKLGFVKAGTNRSNYRFILPQSGSNYLTLKAASACVADPHSPDKLIVRLNNLWIYETRQGANAFKASMLSDEDLIGHVYINGDLYIAGKNGQQYIGTIDTTILKRGWVANTAEHLLEKAFLAMVAACDSIYRENKLTATHSTTENNLVYPILHTSQPKHGVYKDYSSFLNNTPFEVDLTVTMKSTSRAIHSSNIPDSVLNNCWGFCDETGIYINIDKDYYKLNRCENTFDLLAPLYVDVKNPLLGKFIMSASSLTITPPLYYADLSPFLEPSHRRREYLRFFQLDIRTGILR